MKDRFIRCLSPITLVVIGALDIGVVLFGVYCIKSLVIKRNLWTIMFALIVVFALVVAVLVTIEVLKNGVVFKSESVEFTGLDDNNIFKYSNIKRIESSKDTKASLKKNFVDRYSHIVIYLDDDSSVTINLGLTTNKTLNKIVNELNSRI